MVSFLLASSAPVQQLTKQSAEVLPINTEKPALYSTLLLPRVQPAHHLLFKLGDFSEDNQ